MVHTTYSHYGSPTTLGQPSHNKEQPPYPSDTIKDTTLSLSPSSPSSVIWMTVHPCHENVDDDDANGLVSPKKFGFPMALCCSPIPAAMYKKQKKQVRFLVDENQRPITTTFSYPAALPERGQQYHDDDNNHNGQDLSPAEQPPLQPQDIYWTAAELRHSRMAARECIREYSQLYPSLWEYLNSLEEELLLYSSPACQYHDINQDSATELSEKAILACFAQSSLSMRGLEVHVTRIFQQRRRLNRRRVLLMQEQFRGSQQHEQQSQQHHQPQQHQSNIWEEFNKTYQENMDAASDFAELLRDVSRVTSAASRQFAYQMAQADMEQAAKVYGIRAVAA